MEETKKTRRTRYRAIRWVIGFLIFSVYMATYALIEGRIRGKKKWVVVFIVGLGASTIGMLLLGLTMSPTQPSMAVGVFFVSWIVLLGAVTVYQWLSLPKAEKTWW